MWTPRAAASASVSYTHLDVYKRQVEIGVKFIAIPYLMEEDRPGTPKFEGNVKLCEEIAKACKAHGIQTLYHNHDFESVSYTHLDVYKRQCSMCSAWRRAQCSTS